MPDETALRTLWNTLTTKRRKSGRKPLTLQQVQDKAKQVKKIIKQSLVPTEDPSDEVQEHQSLPIGVD